MSERRTYVRMAANVVVSLSTPERQDRVGVTSDVSAAGLLVHSLSKFEVGERVSLRYRSRGIDTRASGRVVRAGRDDTWHMFPNVTAVAFERLQPGILQDS